jgi:hypothetical protein
LFHLIVFSEDFEALDYEIVSLPVIFFPLLSLSLSLSGINILITLFQNTTTLRNYTVYTLKLFTLEVNVALNTKIWAVILDR